MCWLMQFNKDIDMTSDIIKTNKQSVLGIWWKSEMTGPKLKKKKRNNSTLID